MQEFEGYIANKQFENQIKLPIEKLYKKSIHLAQYFMFRIIRLMNKNNNNIIFKNKCVTILLDCSVYIQPNKKILNMLILCEMTIIFINLNIKYSIGLFGDGDFKIIMKQFEEEHSLLTLQQVYECLMLKRYRTNLASVIKFSKNQKFIKNLNFYEEHPYKIIYIITDGLDEELSLIDQWKKILEGDRLTKYGFIFNKPDAIGEIKNDNLEKYNTNINIQNSLNDYVDTNISSEINNSLYNSKNDIEKGEERDFDLIITMWKNFMNLNSLSIKTTLINTKDDKINEESIINLSIDFAELICCLNMENDKNEKEVKINIKFKENNPINLKNFDFIKDIKYFYNIKEIPYAKNNINFVYKKISQIQEESYEKYSFLKNSRQAILKSIITDKDVLNEFHKFINKEFFTQNQNDIEIRKILDHIFVPNKASQKVLSTTGSEIDINAFFLHYLSHDPEPLFYLEEKGGYIRKYCLSIIIDISKSSLNEFNKNHSYMTIKTIFKFLKLVDISCLDVIVATEGNPIILCNGINSRIALKKGSEFWIGLIYCLCNPSKKVYLSPCIDIAYYLNRERYDYTNYIFILTNGEFSYYENQNIIEKISKSLIYNIKIFGIGLGFYPLNINNLFPNVIYAKTPDNLFKAISYFFDKNVEINNDSIKALFIESSKNDMDFINDLTNYKDNTITNVKYELQNKFIIQYTLYNTFNKPSDVSRMKNTYEVLNDPNLQMLRPGVLNGNKILIVMLWSYEINPEKENPKIIPGYLFESGIRNQPLNKEHKLANKLCVEKAIKNLGGEIYVVTNYKDANEELLKSNKHGKCPYYSVWLMSGSDKCILPDKDADPNLLNEFLNILHIFNSNGGSVVLFGESDPLFFQANLFLKQHKFPTKNGLIKTNLRLIGNHKGNQILVPDDSGDLKNNGTFNSKEEIYDSINDNNNPLIKRPSLGYNLSKIYEGETISYSNGDNHDIIPFHKFAVDSEGGATILIYYGIKGHGDVIVDGGFTKCFLSMEEEGTFKYLQNLAAFTARIECNFNKVGLAKNINYIVQEINKPIPIFKRTIFVIDSEVSFKFKEIIKKLEKNYCNGDIIYLANSKDYKININDIYSEKLFEPDFSVDNNIILKEINDYEYKLYNEILIISIGQQIKDNIRIGDLLFSGKKLKYYYNIIYFRFKSKKYTLEGVKKTTNNINDLISFNLNFKFLRNCLYNSYYNSDDEKKNSYEEIKIILNNLSNNPNLKLEEDSIIKKGILNSMINSVIVEKISPYAADKNSK